jgi:cytochrome oxidase Cu insertion factor (SCO1/SenC/PrrC family)
MHRLGVALLLAIFAAGCGAQDGTDAGDATEAALGPADGQDLPATDIERVAAGDLAPDFTLASLAGTPVTLSSFRGRQNVVLVFYRGHW